MNFKEILELIDKVADRGIAGVEIEQAGTKIRIEGKTAGPQVVHSYSGDARGVESPGAAPAQPGAAVPPTPEADLDDETGLHVITSPIVGTFYRAANPEADVFVNVGDRVAKGTVLCIVEAMKLMNEIESDAEGVIVRIYPQNAQPIEYGEKLFAVRVSS
ncbi:MAG: acetyl-CoA carboxylase biotin carboxyl carrier protein [Thermoanaerobaculia bacterium]